LSSSALFSRRRERLSRTASTEKRAPIGKNIVHAASTLKATSPPFIVNPWRA
jgi:hypothetical protein